MMERVSLAGASLSIPPGSRTATTVTDDGRVTTRYFIEPVIVIAVGAVDAVAPALDLAAGIRAAYAETRKFRRETASQPDALDDGTERALLGFRWSSRTGEEQASRVLVVRRGDLAVGVNATVPASRLEELEPMILEVLDTVRLDQPAGG